MTLIFVLVSTIFALLAVSAVALEYLEDPTWARKRFREYAGPDFWIALALAVWGFVVIFYEATK